MIAVTECTPLAKGRLRVCLDNGEVLTLYRREAAEAKLLDGGCISQEEYRRLIDQVLTKRATKRALYLLERMDRSERELRGKLADAYPPECVEAAVAYLLRFHYLDDYRYACTFIRCKKEKNSRRRLISSLRERGVAPELIERALLEEYTVDEDAQICALLRKRQFAPDADTKERARVFRYLAGRGFESSAILRSMQKFGA